MSVTEKVEYLKKAAAKHAKAEKKLKSKKPKVIREKKEAPPKRAKGI